MGTTRIRSLPIVECDTGKGARKSSRGCKRKRQKFIRGNKAGSPKAPRTNVRQQILVGTLRVWESPVEGERLQPFGKVLFSNTGGFNLSNGEKILVRRREGAGYMVNKPR